MDWQQGKLISISHPRLFILRARNEAFISPLLASTGMLLAIAYSCHAAVIPIFGNEAFHQGDSGQCGGDRELRHRG